MARVVCVTLHAVIDDTYVCPGFKAGRTQRAAEFTSYPVGKGVSCAAAVASLGHAANCTVFVLCGEEDVNAYRETLSTRGYEDIRIVGGTARTRRHATVIDPTSDAPVTHVQVPGIPHPPSLFEPHGAVIENLTALAEAGGVVALSGSLPKGAPVDFYATLIRAIHSKGAKAVLDTSGPALHAGLQAAPFAAKPNRAEAEELLEHPIGAGAKGLGIAACEILKRFGLTWVMLSDGKDGMVVAGPLGVHHGCSVLNADAQAKIVNDQGCGDSVVAAFITALSAPGGITDPVALVSSLLVAGTANLFSSRPGELPQEYLSRDKHGDDAPIKIKVTSIVV